MGGVTTSPEFYLHVLNTKEFNLGDFLLDNYYIIIPIIIALLAVLLFIIRKK